MTLHLQRQPRQLELGVDRGLVRRVDRALAGDVERAVAAGSPPGTAGAGGEVDLPGRRRGRCGRTSAPAAAVALWASSCGGRSGPRPCPRRRRRRRRRSRRAPRRAARASARPGEAARSEACHRRRYSMAADARAICRHVSEPRLELVPVGVGAAYARPGRRRAATWCARGRPAVAMDLGSGTLNLLQTPHRPRGRSTSWSSRTCTPTTASTCMALRVYMVWGPGAAGAAAGASARRGCASGWRPSPSRRRWDAAFAFEDLAGRRRARSTSATALTLRHREVPHLPPTNALRVERGGRVDVLRRRLRARRRSWRSWRAGCDVLLCECSFGRRRRCPGVPHLNARRGRRDRRARRRRAPAAGALLARARPRRGPGGGPRGVRRAGGVGAPGRGRWPREPAAHARPPAGRRRAMIIAVLLSLLLPGLGHAYAHAPARAR